MPVDITETVKQLLDGENKSEISRALDVSRETLYRWERGESYPSVDELRRLAEATDNELSLSFNLKGPGGLEQQVRDLREMMAVMFAGRMELLGILEMMAKDPDTKEAIKNLKSSILMGSIEPRNGEPKNGGD